VGEALPPMLHPSLPVVRLVERVTSGGFGHERRNHASDGRKSQIITKIEVSSHVIVTIMVA
jgi:hypothetical protein